MIRFSLTGGIACGKSRAGAALEARNIPVCEADELGHRALAEAGDVRDAVVDRFGPGICDAQGNVVRNKLAAIVFRDEASRRELEAIVHPWVAGQWRAWLLRQEQNGRRMACVIVPLLFEGNFHHGWDAVISVVSTRRVQVQRLAARGLTEAESESRLNAQWSVERKMAMSDFVVVNNGDIALLESQLNRIIWRMQER